MSLSDVSSVRTEQLCVFVSLALSIGSVDLSASELLLDRVILEQ